MKATITAKGVLRVKPENDLESYALQKWFADWRDKEEEAELEIVINEEGVQENVKQFLDLDPM